MRVGVHFGGGSVQPHMKLWFGDGIAFNENHAGVLLGPLSYWNLATSPITRDPANSRYVYNSSNYPFAHPGGGYNLNAYCNRIMVCKCATHNGIAWDLSGAITVGPYGAGSALTSTRPYMAPLRPSVVPESLDVGWDLNTGRLQPWPTAQHLTDDNVTLKAGASSTFTIDTTRLYDQAVAWKSNLTDYIPAGAVHDVYIHAEQWALYEAYREEELVKVSAGKIADGNTRLWVWFYVYAPLAACGA